MPLRQPATPDRLARHVASVRWTGPLPGPRARRRLAELCRAELRWSLDEWRALFPAIDEHEASGWGRHPSEACRLPHEHAAAHLLNAHIHVDVEDWRLHAIVAALRQQRRNARDAGQSIAYRAAWANVAADSLADLGLHRARRRHAWRCFLVLAGRYRTLRDGLALPQSLAA